MLDTGPRTKRACRGAHPTTPRIAVHAAAGDLATMRKALPHAQQLLSGKLNPAPCENSRPGTTTPFAQ